MTSDAMSSDHPNVISFPFEAPLEEIVGSLERNQFVHIDHSKTSAGDNLIQIARKSADAKNKVVALANRGYSLYRLNAGVSSFVSSARVKDVWGAVKEGAYKAEDGMIYSVAAPEAGEVKKLLVIFSSISAKMYQSGLARHFEQNFASAAKHTPQGTAILRIADLGGVCGAFYLNTNYFEANEDRVSRLIEKIRQGFMLLGKDVLFFGTSKGGSAALYYGVKHNISFVAVDPIVSDEHYVHAYRDAHFTVGVFPATKQQKFSDLFKNAELRGERNRIVLYSARSPQFGYITNIVRDSRIGRDITFVNCLNDKIENHPDVAPVTRDIWQAAINLSLVGLPMRPSLVEIC